MRPRVRLLRQRWLSGSVTEGLVADVWEQYEQALESTMVVLVVNRMAHGILYRPVQAKYNYRNVEVVEMVEMIEMIEIHGDSRST